MKTTTNAPRAKNKILRVWIERKPDDSPDTSWLGTYTEEPKGWHWDRQTGQLLDSDGEVLAADLPNNYERGELRYVHGFQHNGEPGGWEHVSDGGLARAFLSCRYRANGNEQGLRGNLFSKFQVQVWPDGRNGKIKCLDIVYCCLNAYRLYRAERGDWTMIGIIAKAEIWNPRTQVTQIIRSPGLWGIESDSDPKYLTDVGNEELIGLRFELENLGIGTRAIDYAFRKVTTKE